MLTMINSDLWLKDKPLLQQIISSFSSSSFKPNPGYLAALFLEIIELLR